VVAFATIDSPREALTALHHVKERTDSLTAFELMDRRCIEFVLAHAAGVRVPLALWPDWFVLLEFQSLREATILDSVEEVLTSCLEAGLLRDVLLSRNEREAQEFWHVRESISGCLRFEGAQINNDICVPVSQVATFLDLADAAVKRTLPDARIAAFGHAGDGNIHYTVLQLQR
jgi:FAD/FMN-containing dehydrogenase